VCVFEAKIHGGIYWHVLARFWGLWKCCSCVCLSERRNRPARRLPGIRFDFTYHVLRDRPHFGLPFEPGCFGGTRGGRRFPARELPAYIGAQLIGGIVGAAILYTIARGKPGFDLAGGFAANGYGTHSPGQYALQACAITEVVLTFMFLMIILGATDRHAPQGFAPIAIGFGLTLVHLIGIPITNLSVNPARSTGPAVIAGGWAIEQLWLFWLAPLVGAALAGLVYPAVSKEDVRKFVTVRKFVD